MKSQAKFMHFHSKNASKHGVCEMASILSRPQCAKRKFPAIHFTDDVYLRLICHNPCFGSTSIINFPTCHVIYKHYRWPGAACHLPRHLTARWRIYCRLFMTTFAQKNFINLRSHLEGHLDFCHNLIHSLPGKTIWKYHISIDRIYQ